MHAAQQQFLAEVLVRRGVVPADRVDSLLETVREKGQPLTDVLVQAEVAAEESIAQAFAEEWGVRFMDRIDVAAVPLSAAERIPITYAKQHRILVLSEDENRVYCAVADPLDVTAADDVRAVFGKPVELCVATTTTLLDAINRVSHRSARRRG